MKDPTLILTEQCHSDDPLFISALVRQAVTSWLVKELTK